MTTLIILPHQLYHIDYIDAVDPIDIILWEHPHYFQSFNYNKKKLILHRASMKYYQEYLASDYNVKYVEYHQKIGPLPKLYLIFDPIDRSSSDHTIYLPKGYQMIESPNFILTKEQYQQRRKQTKKFFFNSFYMWGKKQIDVIPKVKSTDKQNRSKLPNKIKIPSLPSNTKDQTYIKEAIKYVNKHFPNNYGNTDNFQYPITHHTAEKWLDEFIQKKFVNFGKYQDAISDRDHYLFHSVLSSSINIGLINPSDIIDHLLDTKKKIPINSLEGYIRQLFWREYQRYCYLYYDFKNKNYFGNKKKLDQSWYQGSTGILPIDNAIVKAFDLAYLHHIERLMVIGNYMNLSMIDPWEGFRWFMEFSIDSYLWVMHQNVLDMVFFVTGGDTMRRPYSSSSNYILKMSDYKDNDDGWVEEWDNKYHRFINKNKKLLWKFRYYFPTLKYNQKEN